MKETRVLLALISAYLAAGLVLALQGENKEFIFYLVGAPFIVGFVSFLHLKTAMPAGLLRALTFLGFLHVLGGVIMLPDDLPVEGKRWLYNLWLVEDRLKYDNIVHAYGNGVATWLTWHLLRFSVAEVSGRAAREVEARPLFLFICLFAGMGVGTLNEIAEFVATLIVGNTNVGGYTNTGWDLVANTLGSVVAVLFIRFAKKGLTASEGRRAVGFQPAGAR